MCECACVLVCAHMSVCECVSYATLSSLELATFLPNPPDDRPVPAS